jgi:hypothetical protein
MKKIENIIWTAALLEGEGSFLTKTNAHRPIVSCQMTDVDVINNLYNIWGGAIYHSLPRKDGYKETWHWQLGGEDAVELMTMILPYMFSRRSEKINSVLNIWNTQKQKLNNINDNGIKAAKEYLNGGTSLRKVAKKYSITYETVRRYINKINK